MALDHSFDANLTIFPDGHLADYRSDITGHPDSANVRTMQMNTRVADISFILDQLDKIQSGKIESQINAKINLERIAVGGHSYGGSTATVVSQRDDRIKACFVLDSWISPIPQETIDDGVHIPFLFLSFPFPFFSLTASNHLRYALTTNTAYFLRAPCTHSHVAHYRSWCPPRGCSLRRRAVTSSAT